MADLQVSQAIVYVEVEQSTLQVSQAIAYVEVEETPTVSLDVLSLQSIASDVLVVGPVSVSLDTLPLLLSAENITISPSSVSISVNELVLSGLANDISVQIGVSTITLSELILLTNAQAITVSTTTGRVYGPALQ